jgi:hypothetical protein
MGTPQAHWFLELTYPRAQRFGKQEEADARERLGSLEQFKPLEYPDLVVSGGVTIVDPVALR